MSNCPCDLWSNGYRLALLSSYCLSFWLISLWRSKWPRASVCTDADKPRVNFNKANCSLCTSVAPKTLPALLAEMLWDQPSHLLLQDFMSCARSESTQDISEWFQLAVLFFFFFKLIFSKQPKQASFSTLCWLQVTCFRNRWGSL